MLSEKMKLIKEKAEELELLAKKKDPDETRIRILAIDIKILIQQVMIEMDLQDEIELKGKRR
jgi:hypothetical protein